MAIADELIALLGFELTGEDAARRYESTLRRVEKTAERVGAAIGTGIRVASLAAAAGISFLGKSVIDVNAQFESYQATLETIEGSADKARSSLDWLVNFARHTPYDVAGLTQAFIKLKAYGIDPLADDTMRVLGDTASAMGKTLNEAVEAYADAGTFQFERLREFGVTTQQVGDQVTFSWVKNGETINETVKKNATEVRAWLLNNFGERFTGAMDRQSRTWNGMMSNLGETWVQFQRRVGEAGFFDTMSLKLQNLLDWLDRLDQDGTLDEWAANISAVLTTIANTFEAIATRLAENAAFIAENWDSLQYIAYGLAGALALLVAKAFPITFVFGLIALAVDDFLAYLQGGESVIGKFIDRLREFIPVSDEVAAVIAGLGAAVTTGLIAAFALKPIAMTRIAVTLVAGLARFIAPLLVTALTALGAAAGPIATGLTAAFAFLATPVGWAVILAGIGAALVAFFWDDLKGIWDSVNWSELGQAIGDGIIAGLQGIGQQIMDSIFPEGPGAAAMPPPGRLHVPSPEVNPYFEQAPTPTDEALDYMMELQRQEWERMQSNLNTNLENMGAGTEATLNDQRQDNRSFPQTNNITVNQTVTQPSAAPGQAAQATGQAVQGAVTQQRSQIETEPSF